MPSRLRCRVPALVAAAALAAVAAGAPVVAQEGPPADTAQAEGEDAVVTPDGEGGPPVSPLGALARSFVLPGWGQVAVDRPGRGAVYFTAEAASLFMVFKTHARLQAARRGARDAGVGPEGEDPLVESRTRQREDWIVLSVFLALMSGVDAWIGAHLHDFEPELVPPEDGSAGVELRYRLPLKVP